MTGQYPRHDVRSYRRRPLLARRPNRARQTEQRAWKVCLLVAALTLPVMSTAYVAQLTQWVITHIGF